MDSIQAVTSKTPSTVPAAGVDNESTANEFFSLLQLVGAKTQPESGWADLEAKLLRDDNRDAAPKVEPREDKTTDKDRRDDKTTVKRAKDDNSEDKDTDKKAERKDAAADAKADDSAAKTDAATDAQNAATAAAEASVLTTLVIAPVVVAETVAVNTQAVVVDTQTTGEILPEVTVGPAVAVNAAATAAATITGPAQQVVTAAPEAVTDTPIVEDDSDDSLLLFQQTQQATVQGPKAAATGPAVQNTQTASKETAKTDDTGMTAREARSTVAADQANALAAKLGGNDPIRVQVKVDTTNTGPLMPKWSPFNHFVGYNPNEMRTLSTANGQVGQVQVTNAVVTDDSSSPVEPVVAPAAPTLPPAPQPQAQTAQQGSSTTTVSALRADAAATPTRPGDAPTFNNQNSTNQSPTGSFASTLSQATEQTQTTQQSTATDKPAASAQEVIEQIKVNITRAAKAGLDRVTIKLKPAELGRIEVKLELSNDGRVRAMVTADNKDTLQLLQGDARNLEKALNEAGLRTDSSNLEFNLRSETDARMGDTEHGRHNGRGGAQRAEGDAPAEDEAQMFDYAFAAQQRGGVDTFA